MIIETDKYLDEIRNITDKKEFLENRNPFSKTLVYLLDYQVIGFLQYHDMYETLDIVYIYVLNEYRRKQIGSNLLEYLIEHNKGKENITLEVSVVNKKAIALYQKCGFKQVVVRKGYYNGTDGILMERSFKN